MRLNHGIHLAYCTNIHRGETWLETFESLKTYTLAVKQRVCPDKPYAIGLRLSNQAALELSQPETIREFKQWLDENGCYVFTINGFPFGKFHGTRVKEQVYLPDWTSPERLDYTNLLFDILAQLLPPDVEGSVSTVPCGFKEFVKTADDLKKICDNLLRCVEHIARVCQQTGRKMHLGLEPEPLCYLETTAETVRFFYCIRAEHQNGPRLNEFLGVNYDTCHLAVEFEDPREAIARLQQHEIKISKLHLSSALKVKPTDETCAALKNFADEIYLHQTIVRDETEKLTRFKDLPDALSRHSSLVTRHSAEWRIHFHIPLHSPPTEIFQNTTDHLLGVLDLLAANPKLCSHLEMETYTWEVLPVELKNRSVVDQLVAEYNWTLKQLAERGLKN